MRKFYLLHSWHIRKKRFTKNHISYSNRFTRTKFDTDFKTGLRKFQTHKKVVILWLEFRGKWRCKVLKLYCKRGSKFEQVSKKHLKKKLLQFLLYSSWWPLIAEVEYGWPTHGPCNCRIWCIVQRLKLMGNTILSLSDFGRKLYCAVSPLWPIRSKCRCLPRRAVQMYMQLYTSTQMQLCTGTQQLLYSCSLYGCMASAVRCCTSWCTAAPFSYISAIHHC